LTMPWVPGLPRLVAGVARDDNIGGCLATRVPRERSRLSLSVVFPRHAGAGRHPRQTEAGVTLWLVVDRGLRRDDVVFGAGDTRSARRPARSFGLALATLLRRAGRQQRGWRTPSPRVPRCLSPGGEAILFPFDSSTVSSRQCPSPSPLGERVGVRGQRMSVIRISWGRPSPGASAPASPRGRGEVGQLPCRGPALALAHRHAGEGRHPRQAEAGMVQRLAVDRGLRRDDVVFGPGEFLVPRCDSFVGPGDSPAGSRPPGRAWCDDPPLPSGRALG
jgi:hypothetical protein